MDEAAGCGQKSGQKTSQQSNWWKWTGEDDWACIHCDTVAAPGYFGNYADADHCAICGKHKRISHHMTMAVRAWRLKNGTLYKRAEMLEKRANKKQVIQDDIPNHVNPVWGIPRGKGNIS